MVRGKNRLTILDTLGFAFNEAVTLDVSGYAGSFRSFLEKQLGCVLKSNPAVPKPTVLTPHVLDSDAPHLPKREARRPRVFYVCGNHISPVFGPEEMYQHVDLLNANGYEAYLVHRTPGFRCTWFPNETKVIDLAQVGLYYNALLDYVVLGDDLAHTYPTLGGRKVIFSKEMESLFCALSGGDGTGPIAVLCASDDGARLMSWSRPEVPAFPIRSRAVSDEFRFRPWSGKKPMIALAYDPSSTAELVIRLIMERTYRNHRFSRRFRWVRINDLHGQRLASSLGDALVLLNFENANRPMLSVEAMTCGCLTPFDAVQSARHVQLEKNEDPFEAAGLIERVMRSYPKCPVEIEPRIQQGQILARRYSRPQIEADVLAVWKRIISLSPID